MTDFAHLLQPDRGEPARRLHIVDARGLDDWLAAQPAAARTIAAASRFTGKPDELAILPGTGDDDWSAAIGVGDATSLTPWCLARASGALPEGRYRIANGAPGAAALGWLMAQYRFDRYRKAEERTGPRILLSTEPATIEETVRIADAVAMVRDLVNIPAGDLGPEELEQAVATVARAEGGTVSVTRGDALEQGYPMIHAVGRAATRERAPRLIELTWGDPAHPRIAIVGKGVCFDSGGLDIKPASAMLAMKKDMGGAAHALALAQLVMRARLPVRLHLLIPAVENAISADAFRPGDILASRAGIFVEIGNTDAEGRLVLGDALTRAGEEKPELVIDFATLTGAARVALGPDLPALFGNDEALVDALLAAGTRVRDPMWRLPLWTGYADMLKSGVADINNAGEGGMAGAITAALFLQRFVPDGAAWAHLDTFAWRTAAKPGRPKGGEAIGLRAAWAMLERRYRLA